MIFCGFRSVAVNSVYKLQFFFYIYMSLAVACWGHVAQKRHEVESFAHQLLNSVAHTMRWCMHKLC